MTLKTSEVQSTDPKATQAEAPYTCDSRGRAASGCDDPYGRCELCPERNADKSAQPPPDFAPAQVFIGMPPLVGCFNNAEAAQAAALVVLVCRKRGAWGDVEPKDCGEILRAAQDDATSEPILRYPFLRPDAFRLVKEGFAEWCAEPGKAIRFTTAGYEAMRRWVR